MALDRSFGISKFQFSYYKIAIITRTQGHQGKTQVLWELKLTELEVCWLKRGVLNYKNKIRYGCGNIEKEKKSQYMMKTAHPAQVYFREMSKILQRKWPGRDM